MAKGQRKAVKRELERAAGNLSWYLAHLQTVYEGFEREIERLNATDFTVPESYNRIMADIALMQQTAVYLLEVTEEFRGGL